MRPVRFAAGLLTALALLLGLAPSVDAEEATASVTAFSLLGGPIHLPEDSGNLGAREGVEVKIKYTCTAPDSGLVAYILGSGTAGSLTYVRGGFGNALLDCTGKVVTQKVYLYYWNGSLTSGLLDLDVTVYDEDPIEGSLVEVARITIPSVAVIA